MLTLSDEVKVFIVKRLARFDTPSEVVEAVKAHFDIEVTRQHVYSYDPRCTQPPAPRWRELHAATRATFLREQSEIGIAHRNVRLRMLDRMAHRAEARNYISLACAVLEQAAKECGGRYEGSRRKDSGRELTIPAPSDRESPAVAVLAAR